MNQHTRIRQTDNLLAYRPEMVRKQRVGRALREAALSPSATEPKVSAHSGNGQPRKSDIQKVEAIWLAADRALQAAALGQLRESPAGHALLNAIFDLTDAQEVYDLALEWGMHAGTVECEA